MESKTKKLFLNLFFFSTFLDLHIFYNRYSTIVRMLFLTIMFLVVLKRTTNKKENKKLFIFFMTFIIYTVVHAFHANRFTNVIATNYSLLEEFLYAYKMLGSYLIIYVVLKINLKPEDLIKYIKYILWFISGSIVITNFFMLGYETYTFNKLTYNIFSWFNTNVPYTQLSSKGYFHFANQIIAIILLYFPFLLEKIKSNFKIKDIILSFFVMISLLMLGNRIAGYGGIIVLSFMLFTYVMLVCVEKEVKKTNYVKYLVFSILVYSILLCYSPLIKRNGYYTDLKAQISERDDVNFINLSMEEKYIHRGLNNNFPKYYYPYESDPIFWDELLETKQDLSDSRFLEVQISKRMFELNNNCLDKYLGIGHNRIINVVNIEKDFIMQYYSVGILGILMFLGIYFVGLVYITLRILMSLDKKLNYKNVIALFAIVFYFIAAYYSGNILNSISGIIPISIIIGVTINGLKERGKFDDHFLGFKVYNEGIDSLVKSVEKDLIKEKKNIVYNINPIIAVNLYKNEQALKHLNSEKYVIPDGVGVVYASKLKGGIIKQRITGVDLFWELINLSNKHNLKVMLYGSKPEVVSNAKKKLLKKHKNLILSVVDGYQEESLALKKIQDFEPDVLFVGTGSPKQEKFIMSNKEKLKNIRLIMPVGGTFDVVGGAKKRAPKMIVNLQLEWLHRMIKEPKRFKELYKLFLFLLLVIFNNKCYNNGDVK